MQPVKQFFVIVCLCSLAVGVHAQSLDEKGGSNKNANGDGEKTGEKMNILKVNLFALPLKNFSFQYERVVTKHISLALGIRTMPSSTLPFQSTFVNIADVTDQQTIDNLAKFKTGNLAITPEVRFYLSKKGYGRGFYIAPYYRYAKFSSEELPVEYNGSSNTNTIRLKGDVTTNSGGLMFGVNWKVGKAVSIDWWILGAHYGTSKGTLSGTPSQALTQQEQDDLRNEIESIDIPLTKIKAEVTANSAKAIFDGPWGGIRSGLTLGIRF